MMTSEPTQLSLEISISSPSDPHAKIFQLPTPTGEGWKVNAQDCFTKRLESFAWFDRDSPYLKTSQGSLLKTGGSTLREFSGRFGKAGTMLNGRLYRLPAWERRIYEKGCSLWPTPASADAVGSTGGSQHSSLRTKVRSTPTPTAQDSKNCTLPQSQSGGDTLPVCLLGMLPIPRTGSHKMPSKEMTNRTKWDLETVVAIGNGSRILNPQFVEWMMGFPIGWLTEETQFTDLVTQ